MMTFLLVVVFVTVVLYQNVYALKEFNVDAYRPTSFAIVDTTTTPSTPIKLSAMDGNQHRRPTLRKWIPKTVDTASDKRTQPYGHSRIGHIDTVTDYLLKKQHNVYESSVTGTPKPTITTLDDIFITVKTTKLYHNTRLALIIKTWFQLAKEQVSWPFFFVLFDCFVLFFFSVLFLLVLRIVLKMICASVFVCTTPNPRSIVWVPELNCLKAYHCIFIKRFLPSGVIMFIYPHIFPVAAVVVLVAFNLFVGTADGIPSIQSILSNCLLLVQFHVSQMLEWSYQCVKSVVVWAWFCGCVCVIVGSRKIIWLQHNFRQCFFVVVALMCLIVKNKWITIITARERNHSVIQSHSIPQEIL